MAKIQVRVLKGRGQVLPIRGATLHYGYHAYGDVIEIEESDFKDGKFARVTAQKPKKRVVTPPPENTPVKIEGDDFTELSGIGAASATKLNELGIETFSQLVEYGIDPLMELLSISEEKAFQILTDASAKG